MVVIMFGVDSHAKRKETLRVVGGATIPKYGIAVDASYDHRFDNYVPGYKVLQVAIVNESFNMIPMDPQKDKWVVHTAEGKKKYTAIANLRQKDPKAWNDLPESTRNLISYPLILPIGARQVIDLFLPANTPLETFTQVDVDIRSLGAKLEIISRN